MSELHKASPTQWALTLWLVVAIAYITFIPVSKNFLLYPLIGSLAVIAGYAAWKERSLVDRALSAPAGAWLAYVVFGVVVAIARDAESWARTLVFLLFWPVVYFVVVNGFKRFVVKIVFYTGAVVTILIAAIFIFGALVELDVLPLREIPAWISAPIFLRYVVDETGAIALSSHSLPPMLWWGAMWIASLACGRRNVYLPPMWVRILAASLAISASIISWRRAILLVLVLSPLVALATWLVLHIRSGRGKTRSTSLPVAAVRVAGAFVIAGIISLGVQPQTVSMAANVVASVATIFGQSPTISNDEVTEAETIAEDDELADKIRQNELRSLTRADSPADVIVGRGFGASIDRGEFIRDMKPWQTELQYHAMYYWTGWIGLVFLGTTAFLGVRALRKAYKQDDSLAGILVVASVGALATLIGNATNPYIQAPGHMWPVFLPFMIAAVMLPRRPSSRTVTEREQLK